MTTSTANPARLSERRFFTGMALAILAVVFVRFSRGFYLRAFFPGHPAPPEPFFALHGIVFSGWIVLLLTQVRLVARRAARPPNALTSWRGRQGSRIGNSSEH